eukprot:1161292-Pelagomonas_calceolata.AAC.3
MPTTPPLPLALARALARALETLLLGALALLLLVLPGLVLTPPTLSRVGGDGLGFGRAAGTEGALAPTRVVGPGAISLRKAFNWVSGQRIRVDGPGPFRLSSLRKEIRVGEQGSYYHTSMGKGSEGEGNRKIK